MEIRKSTQVQRRFNPQQGLLRKARLFEQKGLRQADVESCNILQQIVINFRTCRVLSRYGIIGRYHFLKMREIRYEFKCLINHVSVILHCGCITVKSISLVFFLQLKTSVKPSREKFVLFSFCLFSLVRGLQRPGLSRDHLAFQL